MPCAPPFFMRYFILGTGASLNQRDVDMVRGYRVIAINEAYKLAPWADMLYACDMKWWDHYIDDVKATFQGERWSQVQATSRDMQGEIRRHHKRGVHHVISLSEPGFSTTPGTVHTGGSSGYQAIQLAVHRDASEICLLGFDGKPGTFYKERPERFKKHSPYGMWKKRYKEMVELSPVPIYNCTRDTVYSIQRKQLEDAIEG